MKALISREVGGPEALTLEDLPDPEARPGHVVVDVKACGVNYPDALIIRDLYQFKPPRPFSPGGEISGIVSAVGAGMSGFKAGDRILASCGWGGMAEKVAIDASRVVNIPDSMPYDEAAAFLMTYGTSHHALKDRADLKMGETLLVLGAAGGVGLAAVEIGKAMGARVIAAASTQDKVDVCLKHGAEAGIVYPSGKLTKEDQKAFSEQLKAILPNGADVIYDPVGDAYAEPALRSIAWEGRYLVVGFAAGEIPKIPLNLALLKNCQIVGVFWGAWVARNPEHNRRNLAELMWLYKTGRIKPLVSATYPLERAAEALNAMANRQVKGKVVLTT